jgi:site-specific DNA-methyltransferase (adenine-specific)
MLPQELFESKETTFLDPVTKSGVFLREIAKRLNYGLKDQIPDQQQRINHIFTRQIYGIAITELTALLARRTTYCTKKADGEYSVCTEFNSEEGNIKYDRLYHNWKDGRCTYCGASEEVYSRGDDLETYAYQFIHTDEPQNIFNMKFDVIVGNPPYQLSDSGHGRSASPIYHKFVEQAKKMNPRYLTMIIPARWYAGGKGLDEFRSEMLNDNRIRKLVDFENSNEVFPGVDIAGGICYFLWDRDRRGLCEITNQRDGKRVSSERSLSEFDILIRHSKAVPIIRKVINTENPKHFLNEVILPRKPFNLPTNYKPKGQGVPCHFTQKIGLQYANPSDTDDRFEVKDKWKLLIPRAPIAGQTDFSKPIAFYYDQNTLIAKPGEICTESWLVAYAASSKEQVENFRSYLLTKIVRFLLLQTVVSQDVTKEKFEFIPHLGKYNQHFTDAILTKRWNVTEEEWNFIDSKIK